MAGKVFVSKVSFYKNKLKDISKIGLKQSKDVFWEFYKICTSIKYLLTNNLIYGSFYNTILGKN